MSSLVFDLWSKSDRSSTASLYSISVGKCYDEYVEHPVLYWWTDGSSIRRRELRYGETIPGWTVKVPPRQPEAGCVILGLNEFDVRLDVKPNGTVTVVSTR